MAGHNDFLRVGGVLPEYPVTPDCADTFGSAVVAAMAQEHTGLFYDAGWE